jgi:hypothetical protein
MSEAAEKLLAQALALPATERRELADLIRASLVGVVNQPESVRSTTEVRAADVIARLREKDEEKSGM